MNTSAVTSRGELDLSSEVLEDLSLLVEQRSVLGDIGKLVANAKNPTELAANISQNFRIERAVGSRIVRALLSLRSMQRSLGVDPNELLTWIGETIERGKNLSWLAAWKEAEPLLTMLLQSGHPLAALEKAQRLAYEYQNVVTRMQILTDVRPVFNEDASHIERGIISFVLRIEYHDGAHLHAVDLALDARDVSELKRLCNRAEAKSNTVRNSLESSFPIGVAGESDL